MKLIEAIDFNPKESLPKNSQAKKIGMEKLSPFYKFIDSYEYEKYSGGSKFRNGDTIVARITPCLENGKTAFIDFLDDKEIAFGSTEFIVMRAKEGITIPEYVYYLSISSWFRNKAVSLMTGSSGRQRVQVEPLKLEEFNFPSVLNQKKIVKLLSNIDNKIKLNNEINKNLSRLCNNIFHNYLDKYEDIIEYKKIIDIANKVVTGKTPKTANKDFWDGSVPFITIPDMHNQIFTIKTERNITELGAKSIIPEKSISVSCIATVGLVSITTEESQTNQQINSIVLNNDYDLYFLYEYLSEQEEFLKSIAGGSTTYNINKNTFENIEIPYLPKDLMMSFNNRVCNMFENIKNNQYENEQLSQLRDTLLPRLMNGEIDFENIEV